MTLDEAIEHSKERAENEKCPLCAKEHGQLAKWLEELKEWRKLSYKALDGDK